MHFISYSRTESLSHLRQKLGTPVWNYFYKETVQFENMVYEQFSSEHGTQVQQKWVDFENRSTLQITDFLLEGGNLVTKSSTI